MRRGNQWTFNCMPDGLSSIRMFCMSGFIQSNSIGIMVSWRYSFMVCEMWAKFICLALLILEFFFCSSLTVLSDFLAVVATTAQQHIEIAFEEELFARELPTVFVEKLRFDEIVMSSNPTTVDLTQNFLLTQRPLASPTNDPGEQKMFFHRHDGYWNGTLIRMRTVADPKSTGYRFRLKIYNKWVRE